MRRPYISLIAVTVLILAIIAGCAQPDRRQGDSRNGSGGDRNKAGLRVLNTQNEVLRSFTIDELRDLDETTATVETAEGTETVEGPTLETFVNDAQAGEADRFMVVGTTRSVTIMEADADRHILDFSDDSVRLVSRDTPPEQWVTGVNQIIVQNIALRVLENDNVVKAYTLEEVRQLTDTTVTVSRDDETRTVTAVSLDGLFEDAGVDGVTRARVSGEDREVALSQDEIRNSVLFTEDGNIRFASPDIDRNRWPREVRRIQVVR